MRLIIAGGVIVVPPDSARVIGSRVSVIIESPDNCVSGKVARSKVVRIGNRVARIGNYRVPHIGSKVARVSKVVLYR